MKEHIKSCLLFLLIMSSIVLTANMWFSGGLWSDGYNLFFDVSGILNFKSKSKSYYLSKENISYPEKIIVNNLERRNLYTHTSDEYTDIIPTVLDSVKKGLTGGEFAAANADEWNGVLKARSVYISYPVAYNTTLLLGILGLESKNMNASSMREFIIGPSDKDGVLSLYVKDYSNSNVYKAPLSYKYNDICSLIDKYAVDSINLLPYSFELNFDKFDSESVEQKVVIEPTVTLKLESEMLPTIKSENYLSGVYSNMYLSSNILKSFGYNTTYMRKYLDNNNTAVYVENYSTLKIYDNGLLEYKAIDDTKGIALTDSNSSTPYDYFVACVEFANNLWDNVLPGEAFDVNLTSDMFIDGKARSFTVNMDYYVGGHMVMCNLDAGELYSSLGHGIEITVKDGKIIEYRQLFNKFSKTNQNFNNGSAIDAIDRMFSDNSIGGCTIAALNPAYINKNKTWLPTWIAKTTDGKIVTIRR